MALPLVFKVPNSRLRLFPGIWNKSPGVSSTNSTTPISTGPQSAILSFFSFSFSFFQVLAAVTQKYKDKGF
uniref:Uncharacterized protein n=1 Tax=Rhizophora mucronata TaxID=61149 RepID=A0A2P2QIQ8_RHIMU